MIFQVNIQVLEGGSVQLQLETLSISLIVAVYSIAVSHLD